MRRVAEQHVVKSLELYDQVSASKLISLKYRSDAQLAKEQTAERLVNTLISEYRRTDALMASALDDVGAGDSFVNPVHAQTSSRPQANQMSQMLDERFGDKSM